MYCCQTLEQLSRLASGWKKYCGIADLADPHMSQAFPIVAIACNLGWLAPRGTPRQGAHARRMSRFFLPPPSLLVISDRGSDVTTSEQAFASVAQVCLTAPPRLPGCLRNTGWPCCRQPPITRQPWRAAMRARFRSRDAWHSLDADCHEAAVSREPGRRDSKKKKNTREKEKHGCWWGVPVGSHSRLIDRLNWDTYDSGNPSGPEKCNHTRAFSEAIMQPGGYHSLAPA